MTLDPDRPMYRWREMTSQRREQALSYRRTNRLPWHSPPHYEADTSYYVLHNAVRHGYVERWQDWPYSNAKQYLEEVGRETAERRWRAFPLLDYGKDWDPPAL
jgi:putative transposase